MKQLIITTCLTLSFVAYSQEPATKCSFGDSCWILVAIALFLIASLLATGVYLFLKSKKIDSLNGELKKKLEEEKVINKNLKAKIQEVNIKNEEIQIEIGDLQKLYHDSVEKNYRQSQQEEKIKTEETEPVNNVYYANYKPQDGFFGKASEENDGYSIWKITMQSQTNATYELADIDPDRYAERWFDIVQIVKCDVPPTGTIISGETISLGYLIKNEIGKWEVDLNNLVEIRFECR